MIISLAIVTCIGSLLLLNHLVPSDTFSWDHSVTPLAHPLVWGSVSVAYLVLIFSLDRLLALRGASKYSAPWFIRLALFHNYYLAALSLAICAGCAWDYAALMLREGFRAGQCHPPGEAESGRLFWWSYVYFLSKYLELLDTVIIVLRRAPLTFLHVYHHSLVLLMSYLWLEHQLRFHFAGVVFNTLVHVFMYQFFAACLTGRRLWWKRHLTGLQIVQFVSSFLCAVPYLCYDLWPEHLAGRPLVLGAHCTGARSFMFSMPLNVSFLFLFWRLYRQNYQQEEASPSKNDTQPLKEKSN